MDHQSEGWLQPLLRAASKGASPGSAGSTPSHPARQSNLARSGPSCGRLDILPHPLLYQVGLGVGGACDVGCTRSPEPADFELATTLLEDAEAAGSAPLKSNLSACLKAVQALARGRLGPVKAPPSRR